MDQEGRLGSLQPGYHADLIVLSDDYFNVPQDQIKDLKSVLTMVDGRVVHDDGTLAVGNTSQTEVLGDANGDRRPDTVAVARRTGQPSARSPPARAATTRPRRRPTSSRPPATGR